MSRPPVRTGLARRQAITLSYQEGLTCARFTRPGARSAAQFESVQLAPSAQLEIMVLEQRGARRA